MNGPVIIQGPGAIGRLLAGRLHRARVPVALLGRSRAQNAGERRTLLLHELDESPHRAELSYRSVDDTPTGDGSLLIITTKAYDVEEALARGLPFLEDDAPVLVLSNGLGHDELLEVLDEERPRLLGTIACGARAEGDLEVGDGAVFARGDGPIEIGPSLCGDPSVAAEVASLLRRAGFRAQSTTDGRRAQWFKAALNCGLNPVAALLGAPNGDVPKSRYFPWAVEAARETALLGRASGLDLPETGWHARLNDLCTATARNRCSMLQDLEAGRRLEIDHLNGWVARRARRLQVPTPRNRRLAQALSREATRSLARFRHALHTPRGASIPTLETETSVPHHRTAEPETGA